MRFFSRPPYFSNTPEDDAEQARRMAEGITFRVVYHTDAITAPGQLAAIRRNIARGERARVTAALPMEMMIADDAQALIPLDPASLDAAYLIHSSSLLTALVALFETSWAHAMPVYLAISDGDEETAADRDALLSLLAGGLTDKEILRHLGWSPRTLQRRVRSLYAQLGASTRFQACWPPPSGAGSGRRGRSETGRRSTFGTGTGPAPARSESERAQGQCQCSPAGPAPARPATASNQESVT